LYDLLSSIEGRLREVPEDAAFALGDFILETFKQIFLVNAIVH